MTPDDDVIETDVRSLALTDRLVDTDVGQALAAVDRRIEFIREVRSRTLKLTLPQDWDDFSGKPRLNGNGCQRLKQPWGLYFRDLRIEPSLSETRDRLARGERTTIEVIGTAGCRVTGEESVIVGGVSSNKPFYEGRDGGLEELDAENLRKHAVTNWEVRAVTDLLGLRGLTWEDVQAAGIKKGQGAAVAFRHGGETTGDKAAMSIVEEIRTALLKVHGEENALEALWLLSKFTGRDGQEQGIRSWDKLASASPKWLEAIAKKVRAEVANYDQRPL